MAAVGKRPVALIAAACVQPPAAVPVAAPPAPAGQTRIWFHRPYEPFESLNLANINVNGNLFGAVANGSAVYRDVPPRHYHIAPESFGQDFNDDKDVDLAPRPTALRSLAVFAVLRLLNVSGMVARRCR